MNVTELARKLKVNPQELRDYLPRLGFDIGQKAIKINFNVAQKIIREWPKLKKEIGAIKAREQAETENTIKSAQSKEGIKKTVKVPETITVREFSRISGLSLKILLAELMKNGIFTSMNEKIDFDTAWLVGSELGLDVKKNEKKPGTETGKDKNLLKETLAKEKKSDLAERPPIIVVMGHVDHGKTKLLDAIRRANVVEGEAGGITQHIGAYQTERHGKLITFIDTPGHEAFTAMRSRGAKVADIAILIVAADDGVKPQTVEAFRIIEAAKIPFVVAINKIDKPEANIDKTKQELSNQLKITPEDWGGKTPCIPISAKTEQNIDELLDTILTLTEMEADNIVANPTASALGTVIESHIDKGAGPVATLLVQNGCLRIGDQLTLERQLIGKVRALENYRGEPIECVKPSMPTKVIGLKIQVKVGDILKVGSGEKIRTKKIKRGDIMTEPATSAKSEETHIQKINLVIKADMLGSAEAIEESLIKINTEKIGVNVIHKGLGNVTEGDIKRAEASDAVIVGFNVAVPPVMEELAREKNITIKTFDIIYNLIKEIKAEMQAVLEPEIRRIDLGQGKVLAIFRTEKDSQIIGLKITEGKAEADSLIEVMRNKDMIASGQMENLQSGKQDVVACETGEECGIKYTGKPVVEEGDILKFYKEEKVVDKI